jgi:hypothetical protein
MQPQENWGDTGMYFRSELKRCGPSPSNSVPPLKYFLMHPRHKGKIHRTHGQVKTNQKKTSQNWTRHLTPNILC